MDPPLTRSANGLPLVRMRLLALVCVMAVSTPAFAQRGASRTGWDAIREGRNADAAAVFEEALHAEPRDPSLFLGAGLAAQLMGDLRKARESFEQALRLAPNLTTASLLLGDLLYRQSDLQGAIEVYEAARRFAPDDKTLSARLTRLREEPSLENGFFQSQSAHFLVLFEGPADEELARRAVDLLESAYWRVGTALYTFPEHVITVVLYTEQQFRDTTRSPGWAAAAYDGRIRIPMRGALQQAPGELERVLTHEVAHAMIRAIAPRGVPTWLNEGIAVMFEPDGSRWAAATMAELQDRIPLDHLEGDFAKFSGDQARIAYAESGEAARRLFEEAGGTGVVALLQDIAHGVPLDHAFEQRTLTSYSAFATTLR
jgi:tetratricopeptide (TPR) repeat protein